MSTTARRRLTSLSGLAVGALGLAAVAGCAGSAVSVLANATGTVGADLAALHIRSAYIPEPASPDVAAAYLSITNTGDQADTLLSVTSPDARDVMAHSTVASGAGTESMVPLSATDVPAHETLAFTVGHDHLMLDSPRADLRRGDHVSMTLTFAAAGPVTLQIPVTGLTGPGEDGAPASSPSAAEISGTTVMPGMDG